MVRHRHIMLIERLAGRVLTTERLLANSKMNQKSFSPCGFGTRLFPPLLSGSIPSVTLLF